MRRHLMRIGTLALGRLTLPELLRYQAQATGPAKARAKTAVIFIELDGGPSQFETYDPKPEAPPEHRSQFDAISTNVPDVHFS